MLTCSPETQKKPTASATLSHDAIRQHRNGSGTISLPSIFSSGGPLDFVDEDRRLPAVFRSYYVIYGEIV